ncbi:hypothetical protein SISNIDRAFT_135716 [Sistotremastrum niveocremeum HHB9708]|uniref:Uncharacterized protein n=2 Tax=Sistotremastraceae TaxID=3402574 RepID=A0A164ZYB7_9AGAM|nr:hypothetical protein SISNIDRAFT_135716 [Sistotremastrum niveocremeum HHB9708]KZT40552.1 hypothetical protein SISSUDRAFT_1060180 [Sistotremastrum suecicum HHB10207 ss-3]
MALAPSSHSAIDYEPIKHQYKLLDNEGWYRGVEVLPIPKLRTEDDHLSNFTWGLRFLIAIVIPPLLAFMSDFTDPQHTPYEVIPFTFSRLLMPSGLMQSGLAMGSVEMWYLLSFSTFLLLVVLAHLLRVELVRLHGESQPPPRKGDVPRMPLALFGF